jgi:hypothetical protein
LNDEAKDKHLKLFRPNLENPANKGATAELNDKEIKRTNAFKLVHLINIYLIISIAY